MDSMPLPSWKTGRKNTLFKVRIRPEKDVVGNGGKRKGVKGALEAVSSYNIWDENGTWTETLFSLNRIPLSKNGSEVETVNVNSVCAVESGKHGA